ESDETVILTLASGTGYTIGNTSEVTGTITNDDFPSVTLAVSPTSVTEDGTPNLIYTFTRTGVTTNALTVNYTVGGTATISTDYTGIATAETTKTVTFATGSSTATVTVDPTADTTIESDETVILTLASGTGYTIGTTNAVTGTITNDDTLPSITLAVSPNTVTEDGTPNLIYTFTRTGVTTNALTVNYTVGGTATIGTDYTGIATAGTTKTVTFAAGSSTATVIVDPTADTTIESDETVALTLATGAGYTIGTTNAVTGTITNDDQSNVDINPPQLTKFDVISDLVVTSNQAQSIQISLDITDDLSGLQSAGIVFTSPSETKSISTTIYDYDRISGNGLNGTYQTSLTLPRFSETGTWRLRDIYLYDKSDKSRSLTGIDLIGSGFDLDFEVTGISDTISPDIVSLTINPKQIDASKNSADVEITVQVTDNLSGLQYLGITFVSPSGKQTLGNTIWADYDRVSGDGVNGVYKKTLTLPALSETGTWKIGYISLYDNSNNGKFLTVDQLTDPRIEQGFVVSIPSTQSISIIGNSGNDSLIGTEGNDYIDGGLGTDTLTGLDGSDIFTFRFGQSLASAPDRITDFSIGADKIDLLTSSGVAMNAPTNFTRAANSTSTTLVNVFNSVFTDADGALTGNQALGVNSAALVNVTTTSIAGTYLVINDGVAGFQSSNDLLVNITGYTGTLPVLGNITVSSFFI
ncbi:MAG: bluetail domain-containing putative surface protein, partial [Dolichospermum sp.]